MSAIKVELLPIVFETVHAQVWVELLEGDAEWEKQWAVWLREATVDTTRTRADGAIRLDRLVEWDHVRKGNRVQIVVQGTMRTFTVEGARTEPGDGPRCVRLRTVGALLQLTEVIAP